MAAFAPLIRKPVAKLPVATKPKPRRPLPSPLPFAREVQRAFGRSHDVGSILAHSGADAATAGQAIGARAYTQGSHVVFAGPPTLERAASPQAVQRQCAACEEEKETPVSRRAADDQTPAQIPPIVSEVNRSSGRPLDSGHRSRFEKEYGWSFANVRVHADDQAAEAARAVNARAYTSGNHIVFARGEFDPASSNGRRLIAHELAHVVQQSTGAVAPGISRPGDPSEREADRLADSVAGGGAPSASIRSAATTTDAPGISHVVQRWPGDGMVPPGDCTWTVYAPLRAAVEAAKAVVQTLGGCDKNDLCPLLATKIGAITAEIAARVLLDTTCFRGGNTNHRGQVQDKVVMLNRCWTQFTKKNCAAELAAAAAAALAAAKAAEAAATAAKAAEAAEAAEALVEGAAVAGEVVEGGVTAVEVLEVIGLILVL